MRIALRVKPGATAQKVGGSYGGAGSEVLLVAVRPPAAGGQATEAALRAVADAFGLPRAAVRLVSGAASRSKLVDIAGEPDALTLRLADLLGS